MLIICFVVGSYLWTFRFGPLAAAAFFPIVGKKPARSEDHSGGQRSSRIQVAILGQRYCCKIDMEFTFGSGDGKIS